MKKFEVGKIYVDFKHCGIGYDECVYAQYYLIDRKSEKSIWVSKAEVNICLYGKDLMSKEEAINIDPVKLCFDEEVYRSKLYISDRDQDEFFYYNDPRYTFKDYVNVNYCKEIGGDK